MLYLFLFQTLNSNPFFLYKQFRSSLEQLSITTKTMAKKYDGPAIDLGTTYSCVAVWQEHNNRTEMIHNDQGNRITPSFVAFRDSKRLLGNAAKNQAASNPTNTIFGN